jgi:vacuolar-type H+-ATPase subunit I/STV1
MVKPVGGRGLRAPYETTHVRVPIPIKASVQALIDEFRERQTQSPIKPLTSLEEAEEEEEEESELSDSETIKSQAEMIRAYASEIHFLKHKLDELNSLTSLEEAKESARSILRAKKSATQSAIKLLTSIYQVEITTDDLK